MQLEIFEDSHGTHSTQFCDEIWSTLWWVHLGTASGEQNRTINSLDGHPTCKKFDYWGQKPYSHQHMSSLRLHMYHEDTLQFGPQPHIPEEALKRFISILYN